MPPKIVKNVLKPKVSEEGDVSTSQEYFNLTKEYEEKYGKNTVVLMQVGSFFEVYGVKNEETGVITHSNIVEFSNICQMNIADKRMTYGNGSKIVMAGFPSYAIDKQVSTLTNAGFTVPVFIQHKDGSSVIRKLDKVYSTGTYVSYDTDLSSKISNNIMCIWLETFNVKQRNSKLLVCGAAVVNIFTGKSFMFQYETQFFMNTTTFDELEKFVSVFGPSEVIIVSNFENKEIDTIIQYSGIQTLSIHRVSTDNEKAKNCASQKYMKHMISLFFTEDTFDLCSEFRENIMATQTFCYLLNFMQEHNPDLVRKISLPDLNNKSDRLILANHTLAQLNIINDATNDVKGQYSSVLSLLNKCCSAMGKRKFQHQLMNPTFDEDWLQSEYDITNHMLLPDKFIFIEGCRRHLTQIRDIEKVCRQLVMKKMYPSSLFHLHSSIGRIQQMNDLFKDDTYITHYLTDGIVSDDNDISHNFIQDITENINHFLDTHFFMEHCRYCDTTTQFNHNIIKSGISQELDNLILKQKTNKETFDLIREYFNVIISEVDKSSADYVKIHETEKSGSTLQITLKRSQTLKKILDSNSNTITLSNGETFLGKEVKFTKASSTNMDIEFPLLDIICKQMLSLKDKINQLISITYAEILIQFENLHYDSLEKLANYVSLVDVMHCKAYIAKQFNYCCPIILMQEGKVGSFVEVEGLRHCLIEHIQQNEIYVTNNVELNESGILLYGTNAVGKTSFIRALGIATIMAQAGLFVPCSSFIYKPYTAIFSRILGNDNIFKGLSTFAVEMSELRIILKLADERSMILGDELCSGTEMESALSIFVTGLMRLHEKRCSFIFATHFHEIVDYEEITGLDRLKLNHMSVRYDRELDCIIYDRKLKEGSGPRIYGLEVCKALHLETDFLESAYAIRNKYYPESRGELSNKHTTYNAKKIRGMCEICKKELGEEIHHMQQQKDADANGFIGSFHKNHIANLLTVCESCHQQLHHSTDKKKISPTIRKKTSKGYILE
jgi:DNA mismatch repair protein MutS